METASFETGIDFFLEDLLFPVQVFSSLPVKVVLQSERVLECLVTFTVHTSIEAEVFPSLNQSNLFLTRCFILDDHSRVKLPQKPGEDHLSSYINANYIRDYADLRPASVAVITDEKDLIPVTRSDAMFIATQVFI